MKSFIAILFLFVSVSQQVPVTKPKLLLISFDGFRWDYMSKTDTPNFDKIVRKGVKAKWIKDTFTSLTFPNHYTIVTGLYEESHGIIANKFYDPVLNMTFDVYQNKSSIEDGVFWGGEPIWITNQDQGGQTGVYYWVGSEAKIHGKRPTIYKKFIEEPYSYSLWRDRVDEIVGWLSDSNSSINLALLYFREPDATGHAYGPDSLEVKQMIENCDNITGYILEKTESLREELNIIITSDHGMTNMNKSRFVTLDDHINVNLTDHLLNYVVGAAIWPKDGETNPLWKNLSHINDNINVWKKKHIPPEYHYTNNVRIPPILMSAKDGWGIKMNHHDQHYLKGRHGFNNSVMDMHPFFIALGPSFKQGYVSEPFENIHIYELMCHLLGVQAAPNNGSFDAVAHILKGSEKQFTPEEYIGLVIACSIVAVAIAFITIRFYSILCKSKAEGYKPISHSSTDALIS